MLSFDDSPRALLHIVARAGLLPRGPLARMRYAKLGRAGGCVRTQAGSRVGPSQRLRGPQNRKHFHFPVNLLMLIQFSFQAEL